jgi:hypothetical protein
MNSPARGRDSRTHDAPGGKGVAPGIAMGRALVAKSARRAGPDTGSPRAAPIATAGLRRQPSARVSNSRRCVRRVADDRPAQAAIFAAQLLMLDDPLLTRRGRAHRSSASTPIGPRTRYRERTSVSRSKVTAGSATRRRSCRRRRARAANLRPGRDPPVDLTHEPSLRWCWWPTSFRRQPQLDWPGPRPCDVGGPTHHTVIRSGRWGFRRWSARRYQCDCAGADAGDRRRSARLRSIRRRTPRSGGEGGGALAGDRAPPNCAPAGRT